MKRRQFIQRSTLTVVGLSALGTLHWNGTRFVADTPTTTDILGPYYRPNAPMRSNLIAPGSTGEVMHLGGTVYHSDGTTPLPNVLLEAWQCDENEIYDNTSDDYRFRGRVKTDSQGRYAFKTIVPVPYQDGADWRPAHIHLRISSADRQDLITQIYFQGDAHIEGDPAAKAPQAKGRILEIRKKTNGEHEVTFDVVMAPSYTLDESGFKKITGIYDLNEGSAEFNRKDELLFMKLNGQLREGMVYKGNNTFEGGLGFNSARFEILKDGTVKTYITMWKGWPDTDQQGKQYEGIKVLKYSD